MKLARDAYESWAFWFIKSLKKQGMFEYSHDNCLLNEHLNQGYDHPTQTVEWKEKTLWPVWWMLFEHLQEQIQDVILVAFYLLC